MCESVPPSRGHHGLQHPQLTTQRATPFGAAPASGETHKPPTFGCQDPTLPHVSWGRFRSSIWAPCHPRTWGPRFPRICSLERWHQDLKVRWGVHPYSAWARGQTARSSRDTRLRTLAATPQLDVGTWTLGHRACSPRRIPLFNDPLGCWGVSYTPHRWLCQGAREIGRTFCGRNFRSRTGRRRPAGSLASERQCPGAGVCGALLFPRWQPPAPLKSRVWGPSMACGCAGSDVRRSRFGGRCCRCHAWEMRRESQSLAPMASSGSVSEGLRVCPNLLPAGGRTSTPSPR